MRAIDNLDPHKVYREIVSHPTWWSSEDDKRKYVRREDQLSVTMGKLGMAATLDEWKIVLKLLTPEVLETIQGFLEDFSDMERMGIRYCYGEKSPI